MQLQAVPGACWPCAGWKIKSNLQCPASHLESLKKAAERQRRRPFRRRQRHLREGVQGQVQGSGRRDGGGGRQDVRVGGAPQGPGAAPRRPCMGGLGLGFRVRVSARGLSVSRLPAQGPVQLCDRHWRRLGVRVLNLPALVHPHLRHPPLGPPPWDATWPRLPDVLLCSTGYPQRRGSSSCGPAPRR